MRVTSSILAFSIVLASSGFLEAATATHPRRRVTGKKTYKTSGGPIVPSGCPALLKKVKQKLATSDNLDDPMLALSLAKCAAATKTQQQCKAGDQNCGWVVVVPPTQNGTATPAASSAPQVVDISKPDEIRKACAAISSSVVGTQTGDPALTIMAGPVGGYTCDAYLKAAARRDPLLIIYPSAVPAVQLTKDLQTAVQAQATELARNPANTALNPLAVPTATVNIGKQAIETVTGVKLPDLPKVDLPKLW